MNSKKKKIAAVIMVICIGAISWSVVDHLPTIGDPNSAPNTHVSDIYIEEGPEVTHSPNLVTGVLADYRAFDTLLETTVMYIAALAVAMVLSNRMKKKWSAAIFITENKAFGGIDVKVVMPFLIPILLLYAAYVLFHGEVSLGGGFQAGALIALSYILYTLIGNLELGRLKVTQHFSVCIGSVGVLIYAMTGTLPMFFGGKFLEYGELPFGTTEVGTLHSTGILMIEVGVTICVMSAIITMLEAVLERNSLHERN